MELFKSVKDGLYDIGMSGKFTFADNMAFREVIEHAREKEIREVVLHMAKLEFIDSAALGMLLLIRDEMEKLRKKLVLSGAAGQVRKMFELAHFERLFTLQ